MYRVQGSSTAFPTRLSYDAFNTHASWQWIHIEFWLRTYLNVRFLTTVGKTVECTYVHSFAMLGDVKATFYLQMHGVQYLSYLRIAIIVGGYNHHPIQRQGLLLGHVGHLSKSAGRHTQSLREPCSLQVFHKLSKPSHFEPFSRPPKRSECWDRK